MNNRNSDSESRGTRVLAIIGDPIAQVKSPATFGEYFTVHRIDAELVPLHVGAEDFRRVLEGLRAVKNFAGVVVTIPYKHEAYNAAHVKGPMALKTETANVLAPIGTDRWSAEMLDGVGLINALNNRNIDITGLRTLLIGAGGAGTAIGVALQQLGYVSSIGVSEPDTNRAERLVAKLDNAEIVDSNPENYQLVVNASPVGMGSGDSPVDASCISPGTIVCDAIMDPPKTRFLEEAERRGCTIVQGIEMLLGQVEPIVRFFGLSDDTIPEDRE